MDSVIKQVQEMVEQLNEKENGRYTLDHLVELFCEEYPIITDSSNNTSVAYDDKQPTVFVVLDLEEKAPLKGKNGALRTFGTKDDALANVPGDLVPELKDKMVIEWQMAGIRSGGSNTPIHPLPMTNKDRVTCMADNRKRIKDRIQDILDYSPQGTDMDIMKLMSINLNASEYNSVESLQNAIEEQQMKMLTELATFYDSKVTDLVHVGEGKYATREIPDDDDQWTPHNPKPTLPKTILTMKKSMSTLVGVQAHPQHRTAQLLLNVLRKHHRDEITLAECLAYSTKWQEQNKGGDAKRDSFNPDNGLGAKLGDDFEDSEDMMTKLDITIQPILREMGKFGWDCIGTIDMNSIALVQRSRLPSKITREDMEKAGVWSRALPRFESDDLISSITTIANRGVLFRWTDEDIANLPAGDIRHNLEPGLHLINSYDLNRGQRQQMIEQGS
ncbi:MAG: hypothetical protein QGG62_02245 [Candidatus Poseidoniaceae archaeon]|jgi:hypothetical protein|nr:hypothetical protein [Candidatus Poseidoniaceae archaeon]